MDYWVCTACKSLNDDRSTRCYRCQAKRSDDAQMPGEPGIRTRVREPSVVGALLAGTAAACFATVAWVSFENGQVSRPFGVALLVGLVVALATVLGARGRTSFLIVMISGLLTTAAVVAGEYLIVSSAITPLDAAGLVVAPPEEVWAAMQEALAEAPLRPVLWAAAVFEGFAIPWARLVGPA